MYLHETCVMFCTRHTRSSREIAFGRPARLTAHALPTTRSVPPPSPHSTRRSHTSVCSMFPYQPRQLMGRTAKIKEGSKAEREIMETWLVARSRRERALAKYLIRKGAQARSADENVRQFAAGFRASLFVLNACLFQQRRLSR